MSEEQVLVIPTSVVDKCGRFHGFTPHIGHYLAEVLDPRHLSFKPRSEMETDPNFKQIIPYIVLRHQDQVFQYTRSKMVGDQRLKGMRSIGVGGHISSTDGQNLAEAYFAGRARELREEVGLEFEKNEYNESTTTWFGMLNHNDTMLGAVHIGIVHLIDVPLPKVPHTDETMVDSGFAPLKQLKEEIAQFERWSQFVLDVL